MTKSITSAQIEYIEDKLDEYGYEYAIRDNYSGRGMMGRKCFGIVSPNSSVVTAVAYWFTIAQIADSRGVEPDYLDEVDILSLWESLSDITTSVRTDNMAMEYIFYWPGLVVVESSDEDDDD